jgi:protein-S-isoprenylcysteine O-methyltransferase Ste14
MFEPVFIAAFPVLFLIVLAVGRAALRRRKIDMEGLPPIKRSVFLLSKLALLIPWTAMCLQALGVNLSPFRVPPLLRWIALSFWAIGFGLALAGRLGLGSSFRVGCPREDTTLRTDGIFRISRNPIYLGLDLTFFAAALFTLNPLVLIIGAGSAAIHHRIILAEEECLQKTHGQAYAEYCRRVSRYL